MRPFVIGHFHHRLIPMPSTFDQMMESAGFPILLDYFADEVRCTQSDDWCNGVLVRAMVGPEDVVEVATSHGPVRKRTRLLAVPRTIEAAGGFGGFLATPKIGDRWQIRDFDVHRRIHAEVEYMTEEIESQTPFSSVLRVVRVGVHEEAKSGYRRRM